MECHSVASILFVQRTRCALNFLLTDCLCTFSAVVEHAGSARNSLIQNYNVTRTYTCGAGHKVTRRQVFNRQVTVCAPVLFLYSVHYMVQLCLYEEAFFICQRTHIHFKQLICWHSRNHYAMYRGSAYSINHISRLYALFFLPHWHTKHPCRMLH